MKDFNGGWSLGQSLVINVFFPINTTNQVYVLTLSKYHYKITDINVFDTLFYLEI